MRTTEPELMGDESPRWLAPAIAERELAQAVAERIDVVNELLVGTTGDGTVVCQLPGQLTPERALVHAAWIVAQADVARLLRRDFTGDDGVPVRTEELFMALLDRVRST